MSNSDEHLLPPDTYAVVEVLGHNTFAGKVSQHVLGGTAFIRVDVPTLPERKTKTSWGSEQVYPEVRGFTKLIGASSIYAITPCSEEVARLTAESRRSSPLEVVNVTPKQLPAPAPRADEEDEDDEGMHCNFEDGGDDEDDY
jgi:hypothetical protein